MSDLGRAVRDYALSQAPRRNQRKPDNWIMGVVTGLSADTNRVDVQFPDAYDQRTDPPTAIPAVGLRRLDGPPPVVGQTVWVIRIGDSMVVVGPMADTSPAHVITPGTTWRFLARFTQTPFGFVRVRYSGTKTLVYFGSGDPSRSLDVIDVSDVDAMAVLDSAYSPDWGSGLRGYVACPLWYPDGWRRFTVLQSPFVSTGGGGFTYTGVVVVDVGADGAPIVPPTLGATRVLASTSGSLSDYVAIGQSGDRAYWAVAQSDFDQLRYELVSSLALTSGDLSWPGNHPPSFKYIESGLSVHPDPASQKVYAFAADRTFIFDGWPPTVVTVDGPVMDPTRNLNAMAALRDADAPTLAGIVQTPGGSGLGATVDYVDLSDPVNPVYSRWDFAAAPEQVFGTNSDPCGGVVVSTSYDGGSHVLVVTRNFVASTLTLWHLDLLARSVIQSWVLPAWPGFGIDFPIASFITKDYKTLGLLTNQGVWGLPLWA